jgi:hypothetical protein
LNVCDSPRACSERKSIFEDPFHFGRCLQASSEEYFMFLTPWIRTVKNRLSWTPWLRRHRRHQKLSTSAVRRMNKQTELLEARTLLTSPNFVSVSPNVGTFLQDGDVRDEIPQELLFQFTPGQTLDAASLDAISVYGAGNDNQFRSASATTDFGTDGAVLLRVGTQRLGDSENGSTLTISTAATGLGTVVTGSTETNEIQQLSLPATFTGGNFTLTFNTQTTAALNFNATAAQIQTALENLAVIDPGDVIVRGGPLSTDPVSVEFAGAFALQNVAPITIDSTNLQNNEVQAITITGDPTGGTFRLSFDDLGLGISGTSAAINYNANAVAVQAAITSGIPALGGLVSVTGGDLPGLPISVQFIGTAADTNVAAFGLATSNLTGGTSPLVSLSIVADGDLNASAATLANGTSGFLDIQLDSLTPTTAQDLINLAATDPVAKQFLRVELISGDASTSILGASQTTTLTGAGAASAISSFSSVTNLQVEFTANSAGLDGNNIAIQVNRLDLSAVSRTPRISVVGDLIRVTLNDNPAASSRAIDLVTALNGNAAASNLITASVAVGLSTTSLESIADGSLIRLSGADTIVTPGYRAIGDKTNEVQYRFGDQLADDLYLIQIAGTGPERLTNTAGEALNDLADHFQTFRIDLGGEVRSIVPQPVLREKTLTINAGTGANLTDLTDGDTFTVDPGVSVFARATSDLGTVADVGVPDVAVSFDSVAPGTAGNGISVSVSAADLGTTSPAPTVTVNGRSVTIVLNSNGTRPTTANDLADAVAANSSARSLLAVVLTGDASATIGTTLTTPENLALSGGLDLLTFEINDTGAGVAGVRSGNVAVDVNLTLPASTPTVVAGLIATAINTAIAGATNADVPNITATNGGTPTVSVTGESLDVTLSSSLADTAAATRGEGGLQQRLDRVVVYFNNVDLDDTDASNPRFYQLVNTSGTADATDDSVMIPTSVVYDRANGTAVLGFGSALPTATWRMQVGTSDESGDTTDSALRLGTLFVGSGFNTNGFIGDSTAAAADADLYRFSVGNPGDLTVAVNPTGGLNGVIELLDAGGATVAGTVFTNGGADTLDTLTAAALPAGTYFVQITSDSGASTGSYNLDISTDAIAPTGDDDNSSYSTATDIGTLGAAGVAISAQIEAQGVPIPQLPNDSSPGHRDIPVEAHGGGAGTGTQSGVAGSTYSYNFKDNYGSLFGIPQQNQITEGQKDLARAIFEIFSRHTGIQFIETTDKGTYIATGDVRVADPTLPPSVAGISTVIIGATGAGNDEQYGGGWMGVALHEIAHTLGLGHTSDLHSFQDGNGGSPTTETIASDYDLDHLRAVYPPFATDIDLYRFELTEAGTVDAEITAERLTGQSRLLDATLTLFRDPFAMTSSNFGGSAATIDFTAVNAGTFGNDITITLLKSSLGSSGVPNVSVSGHSITVTLDTSTPTNASQLIAAIAAHPLANKLVSATLVSGTGTANITTTATAGNIFGLSGGNREVIARNDDYYSDDPFLSQELEAGVYYIGVSAKGNEAYDPTISDSGYGGLSSGNYDLNIAFTPAGAGSSLADADGTATAFDGNSDGTPGDAFSFWFETGATVFVDKATSVAPVAQTGAIDAPFSTIQAGVLRASSRIVIPADPTDLVTGLRDGIYNAGDGTGSIGGDYFTISDGVNQPLVFEFDTDGMVIGSNFRVDINGLTDRADIANSLRNAIHAQFLAGRTLIDATADPAGFVDLSNAVSVDVSNTPGLLTAASILRIVGNGGTDGDVLTPADATPYLIGINNVGATLADGRNFDVPQGVTAMIDAGAVLKLQSANIDVGSTSSAVDRQDAALQVLGTPDSQVYFTTFRDDSIGGDTDGASSGAVAGQWGGIVFRTDSDQNDTTRGDDDANFVFLNNVNQADLRYGGGQVSVNSVVDVYTPIHIEDERPTISFSTITNSAAGAISADPNSFDDSNGRIGPDILGNTLIDNSINGLFIRIETTTGTPLDKLQRQARFDDTDITHVISENLQLVGNAGGWLLANEVQELTMLGTSANIEQFTLTLPPGTGTPQAGTALTQDVTNSAATTIFVNDASVFPPLVGTGFTIQIGTEILGVSNIVGNQLTVTRGLYGTSPTTYSQSTAVSLARTTIALNHTATAAEIQTALENINGIGAGGVNVTGGPINQDKVTIEFVRQNGSEDILELVVDNAVSIGTTGMIDGRVVVDTISDGSVADQVTARPGARLKVDPGVVVKLSGSRIEAERGSAHIIAEGTPDKPVIFTSLNDDRYGAGSGTFDTSNNGLNTIASNTASPGDWGGLLLNLGTRGHFEQAIFAYGGGTAVVEGGETGGFNVLGIHEADARVANSLFEFNASGTGGTDGDRNNRETNGAATIFVRGAQPIIVNNDFSNNRGSVISIDANALKEIGVVDTGASTQPANAYTQFDANQGPLVRLNRMDVDGTPNNALLGMEIRQGDLDTATIWDDTDIVHIVESGTIRNNYSQHLFGGLKLVSDTNASLIVKMGAGAGFEIGNPDSNDDGRPDDGPLDIDDRIGPSMQIIGQPGFPVVITALTDDSVGAALDTDGFPQVDTSANGNTTPVAGFWDEILIEKYSNDTNMAVIFEAEPQVTGGVDENNTVTPTTNTAEFLGELAPTQAGGNEDRRAGFEVHGVISPDDTGDVDVYSFNAVAGTEVWLDIDFTDPQLDTVLELLNANGQIIARSQGNDISELTAFTATPNPLQKLSTLGGDFYATTTRDAGMRITLPGSPAGSTQPYFLRIRSNPGAGNLADLSGGITSGRYRAQIRLQQVDQFPGVAVSFADIRYATNGIHVRGLPYNSPLTGQTNENGTNDVANNTTTGAINLGNLLFSEGNSFSAGGRLTGTTDFDFYRFQIDYQKIQEIAGLSDGGKTWATIIDIDWADGLPRPDTTIAVYTNTGELVYIGRESNVADDQAAPGQGQDLDDLSRGSVGPLDPFIGTAMFEEASAADNFYYLAVFNNQLQPQALNANVLSASGNTTVRLEPVNSLTRIAEDHIGFNGYTSNGTLISPTTPSLIDIDSSTALSGNVEQLTMNDLVIFVSEGNRLRAYNALTGTRLVDYGTLSGGTNTEDIVMRSDGVLYGYQQVDTPNGTQFPLNDTAGQLVRLDTTAATNSTVVPIGIDGIAGATAATSVNNFNGPNEPTNTDAVDALTFRRVGVNGAGDPVYRLYYSVQEGNNSKLYRADPNSGSARDTASNNGNLGYLGDIQLTGVTSARLSLSNLRFDAVVPGAAGNLISVSIFKSDQDPANPSVSVIGNNIRVFVDSNPNTSQQVVADLINQNAAARALVTVSRVGGGDVGAIAEGRTFLAGGTGIPLNEAVTGLAYGDVNGVDGFRGADLFGVTSGGKLLDIVDFNGRATVRANFGATSAVVDFAQPDPDTIIRTDGGNWVTDGFAAGDTITVAGSINGNNGTNAFTIFTISTTNTLNDTITLDGADRLNTEPGAGISITSSGGGIGTIGVTFTDAGPDTIVRTDGGDWAADGFNAGETLTVAGSASNDAGGPYLIAAVSPTTITLNGAEQLNAEPGTGVVFTSSVAGNATTDATFIDAGVDALVRNDTGGDWTADGFLPGDTITVAGSTGGNNGTFTIAAGGVTATTLTLVAGDTVNNENARITVTSGPIFARLATDFTDSPDASSPDTIVRTDGGNWVTDGFLIGDAVAVTNTAGNDDTFTIASFTTTTVADDTIVLSPGDTLSDEVAIGATFAGTGGGMATTNATFDEVHSDTIVRIDGRDWTAEGFAAGQTITVTGAVDGVNNADFTIVSITTRFFPNDTITVAETGILLPEDADTISVRNANLVPSDGVPITSFTALALGPQNIYNGLFANTLFGSVNGGRVVAFQPGGVDGITLIDVFGSDNEQQTLTQTATGGTFRLTYNEPVSGETLVTPELDFDAAANEVRAALLNLVTTGGLRPFLGADINVTASNTDLGDGTITVEFQGVYTDKSVPLLTLDPTPTATPLTAGTIAIAQTDGIGNPTIGGDGVRDQNIEDGFNGATGIAFSNVDFNLWHPTTNRAGNTGHGINSAFDNSRTPTDEAHDITDGRGNTRTEVEAQGSTSLYFGLENYNGGAVPDYLNYATANGQFGVQNSEYQRDVTSSATSDIGDNYNASGGAFGSFTTNAVDLSAYTFNDKPTIYFNYFLDTQDAQAAQGQNSMRDSARVFVTTDGGRSYSLIATNNTVLDAELPEFVSHNATYNGSAVQELFDTGATSGWRQARIDLSQFVGAKHLQFRFDFSTAGHTNNEGLPGDAFGDFDGNGSIGRSQANTSEGFYIDDIIVGFAERGELVTNAPNNTGFDNLYSGFAGGKADINNLETPPTIVTAGEYQVEIRRGTEYAAPADPAESDIIVNTTYDTNDRLVQDLTSTLPPITQTFDLPDEFDPFPLTFGSTGTQPWFETPTDFTSDPNSFRSGVIPAGQSSGATLSQATGAGNITFQVQVDAGSTGNAFQFFIDDVVQTIVIFGTPFGLSLPGTGSTNPSFVPLSFPVTAGAHTFEWRFTRAGNATSFGADAAFIDNLVIPQDASTTGRLGDRNIVRPQGMVVIQGNFISNVSGTGIIVEAADRDTGAGLFGTDFPYPGAGRNTPNLQANLTTGAAITNNVVSFFGGAGIRYSGDANIGAVPDAAVPMGKIINNTLYGGPTQSGTGVVVSNNASPTLINNVIVNTATSINIDVSSGTQTSKPVVQRTLTQNAGGSVNNGVTFSNTVTVPLSTTLFIDPASSNFYPDAGSVLVPNPIIDSSLNVVAERDPAYRQVRLGLGLPQQDMFAPEFDAYGQERVDDTNTVNATGIFKDLGAIERADFAGPTVRLTTPLDNGSLDSDPDLTEVAINNPALLTQFVITVIDPGTPPNPGVGVDDSVSGLVNGTAFVLTQTDVDGVRILQSGIDYIYTYNSNTNEAIFRSVTVFPSEAGYNIQVVDPTQLVDIAGNQVQPNRTDGSVQFDILVTEGANDPPTIAVPGPQTTAENTNGNTTSITFSSATGNAITIDDPDAFIAGGIVQLTLSGANGTITLPAGFGSLATLDLGTGTNDSLVRLTGALDNLNLVLDGLVFTPTVNVNTQEGGPPPTVQLNVSVNDLGNFSSENPPNQQITNDSVAITVTAVNTNPTATVPATATTTENVDFNFTAGNTVSVADPDVGDMLITLSVTNGTLTLPAGTLAALVFTTGDGTADGSMVFTGTVANINTALAGLVFTPNTSFTGTAIMTLVIDDQNNSGAGTTPNATVQTTITVTEVNDPPILLFNGSGAAFDAGPTVNTDSGVDFEFKPSTSTQVSITDIDAAAAQIELTLTASAGTLTLATINNLSFIAGGGTGDTTMTFHGTLADINNALFNAIDGGLIFTPPAGPANSTITLTVNDLGNTGGAAETDSNIITVAVAAADNNPRNLFEGGVTFPTGIPVQEGAPDATLVFDAANNRAISVSDADNSPNITVTLSLAEVNNATLTLPNLAASGATTTNPDGDRMVVFNGTVAQVNAALSQIIFTSDGTNTSTFAITTSDGGGTDDTDMIQITVNDAPDFDGETVLDTSYDFMVNENANPGTIVGTVTALDADVPAIDSLTFAITGGNALGGFAIVKTDDKIANITVADPTVLDFETNPVSPQFSLTVTVTDTTGVLDTTTVNITLNDLAEPILIDPPLWSADSLTLIRVGNVVHIYETGTTNDIVPPSDINNIADITFIAPDNVSNTLIIDYSGGDPVPLGGVSFAGGGGVGVNRLEFVNGTVIDVTHDFAGGGAGTVTLDADGAAGNPATVVTYSQLQPVSDQLTTTNRTFNFSAANDAVTLQDDGTAGDGVSQLVSPTNFSGFSFNGPTGSLTINLGDGRDALTVAGLDSAAIQAVTAIGGDDIDTLIGTDGVDVFTVNATDEGTMVTGGLTTTFSEFESLDGRGDNDTFTVNDGITLSGGINGGDGDDTFNILGTVGGNLDGGPGIDSLTFTGPGTGPGQVNGIISNIERLIISGTVNPDQIVVRLNATAPNVEVEVTTLGLTTVQRLFQPPAVPTVTLVVEASDDDDTLIVDHSNGFVDVDIVFDGQAGADSLQVVDDGSSTSTMTAIYTPGNSTDNGTILMQENGLTQTITFSGLSPVEFTGIAQATLRTPRSSDLVTLAAATGPTSGLSALEVRGFSDGTGFETFYASDVGRVTVDLANSDNAGAPVDTVTIEDGALAANEGLRAGGLVVRTGLGRDVITLLEDSYLSFGGEDALVIDAGQGNTDRLNVNVSSSIEDINSITLTNDDLTLTVATVDAGTVSFLSPTNGLTTIGGDEVSLTGQSSADATFSNVFDLSGWTAGLATVNGGTSTDDTLIGPNVNSLWNVSGSDSGSLNGSGITWLEVENLTGGAANDQFVLATGAGVTVDGAINGGISGNDTIDFSNLGSAQAIVLTSLGLNYNGTATNVAGGFANIDGVTGTIFSDSLTNSLLDGGSNPIAGTFTLNSDAGAFSVGTTISAASVPVNFVDQGVNPDTITRTDGGSWLTDGFIVGQQIVVAGSASNNGTFTIGSLTAAALTLVASDTLANELAVIVDVTAVQGQFLFADFESYAAGNAGDTFNINADQVSVTLTGGTGNDSFNLGAGVLVDGPINTGAGDDALVLNDGSRMQAGATVNFGTGFDTLSFAGGGAVNSTGAYSSARRVELNNLNNVDGGYDGAETLLGFSFVSVNNLEAGNSTDDTLQGAAALAANWTINGDEPPAPTTFSYVFVIDADDSTAAALPATQQPGDVNSDGTANSVLDAQLAALLAFRDQLEANGEVADLSVIAFGTTSSPVDMDPSTPVAQELSTSVTADNDNNGVPDFEDAVRSIQFLGPKFYEDALIDALTVVTNVPADIQTVVFLSDGLPQDAPPNVSIALYTDDVTNLTGLGVTLRAFGVGPAADLPALQIIDAGAFTVLTADALATQLTAFGGGNPGTPLASTYRDTPGTQILEWTRFENLVGADQADIFQFGNFIPNGVPQLTITGGAGADQLVGNDQQTNYTVSLLNGGSVELRDPLLGDVTTSQFRGIENLASGAANDTFTFTNTGGLTGEIDGSGGLDTLIGDNDGNVFNVIPLAVGPASSNQGTIGDTGSIVFSGVSVTFATLVPNTIVRGSGSWAGLAQGQTIAVSGSASNDGLFTIESIGMTNTPNDTITLTGSAALVTEAGATITVVSDPKVAEGFRNIENLVGGDGQDIFNVTGGDLTGSIDGGAEADRVTVGAGRTIGDSIGGGTGIDRFILQDGARITNGVFGQDGNDRFEMADGQHQPHGSSRRRSVPDGNRHDSDRNYRRRRRRWRHDQRR